jgi:hypothetical protein
MDKVSLEECQLPGRHRVALVRTDVSEECISSTIKLKRISELGTMLAVTSNYDGGMHSFKMSVLTRVTQHHIPEDGTPYCHCCENLKSYNVSLNLSGCINKHPLGYLKSTYYQPDPMIKKLADCVL